MYTQELLFSGRRPLIQSTWNGMRTVALDTMFFEVFTRIVAVLSSLRTLEFVDCKFKSFTLPGFSNYIALRDLTELTFTTTIDPMDWNDRNRGDIRGVLRYFRHIDRLVFDRTTIDHYGALPSTSPLPSDGLPSVNALEYRSHPDAPYTTSLHITALKANLDLSTLSVLVLEAVPEAFGHSLDGLLRDVPNLTCLTYDLRGPFIPTIPPELRLHSLYVRGVVVSLPRKGDHPGWAAAMRLLQRTARPGLESAGVSILLKAADRHYPEEHGAGRSSEEDLHRCLGSLDWSLMDEACALCKGLRQFTINVTTPAISNGRYRLPRRASCHAIVKELLEYRLSESIRNILELVVT